MKKVAAVVTLVVAVGISHAALLVEETWNYGIGSDSSTWTGGTGFNATGWAVNTSGATITSGLTFGSMAVSGGAVHLQVDSANTAGTSASYNNLTRQLGVTTVNSGDLWVAYLVKFDKANSTTTQNEGLEVRPEGPTEIRTGIAESSSAMTMRYGTDTTTSASETAIKVDGETFLFVFKYPDLGAVSGGDALGWGLTAAEYDSIVGGGLTEAELSAVASIQLTNSFAASSALTGNATMQFSTVGRNNSTPSFYIDEYRVGTSLGDVVAVPEPATLGLFVISSGFVLMVRRCLH